MSKLTLWQFVEANNGRILSDGVRSVMRVLEFGAKAPVITITDAEREKLNARRHRAIKAAAANRALSIEARSTQYNAAIMAIAERETMPDYIRNYSRRAAYFPRFNVELDNGEILWTATKYRRYLIDNKAELLADYTARMAAAAELKTIDGKSGGTQITIQILRRLLQRDYKIIDSRSMLPLSPAADIYMAAYNAAYSYTLNGYDIKYQRVKKSGEYRAVTKFQAAKAAAGAEIRMHKNASAYTSKKTVQIPVIGADGKPELLKNGKVKTVAKIGKDGKPEQVYTVSPFVFFDARDGREGLSPLETCYIRVPADDGENQFLCEEEQKIELLQKLNLNENQAYIIKAIQANKKQADIGRALGVGQDAISHTLAKIAARVSVVAPEAIRGYKYAANSIKAAEARRAAIIAADAAEDARLELLDVEAARATAYKAKIEAARAAYTASTTAGAAARKAARDASAAALKASAAAAAVEALTATEAARVKAYITAHTITAAELSQPSFIR